MIIRKEFKVESAHIVRNCTSHRCSHSVHGHSARVEVFFQGSKLDNAQMLMDFGLMKGPIKEFIDSMDHCYLLCSKDDEKFKEAIKTSCDRWIEIPFNPSAEMLSIWIMRMISYIIKHTQFNNGEGEDLKVKGVRYHETTTGYAECDENDCKAYEHIMSGEVLFSEGVCNDWSDELKEVLAAGHIIENPVIEQQINLQ
jgi:6-pyruvoyltetrahydropterin/6-carboxytetrahydropterin synthase